MALLNESYWILPVTVFMGGLIGSPHCVAMCGPLVMSIARDQKAILAYQLGRMIAYVSIGAVLGAFGQAVLGGDSLRWYTSVALSVIAMGLLWNGWRFFSARPIQSLHLPLPAALARALSTFWRILPLRRLPPLPLAAVTGLLTVFLPCGHLASFLLGAVATRSAWGGALYMFAFWLGSTPLLSVSGYWLRRLLPLGPKVPLAKRRLAGALLLTAGLFSLATFAARLDNLALKQTQSEQKSEAAIHAHRCH